MTTTNVNVPLASAAPTAKQPVVLNPGFAFQWYPLSTEYNLFLDVQDGGTPPSLVQTSTAWGSERNPAGYASRLSGSHRRAASTFTPGGDLLAQTKPDTYLGDSFRFLDSSAANKTLFGTFVAGTWTFKFVVLGLSTVGDHTAGKLQLRLWHGLAADGSDAVEFAATSTVYESNTVIFEPSDWDYQLTVAASLPETHLAHEYVFVQAQWYITQAGTTNVASVILDIGNTLNLFSVFQPSYFIPEHQDIDVAPARSHATGKKPTCVGGIIHVPVGVAHGAPTAVTPVTTWQLNVNVGPAHCLPSAKPVTIDQWQPVSPASAHPQGITPDIAPGPVYLNVSPAYAAPQALAPTIIILDGTALYLLGTVLPGTNFLELAKQLVSPAPARTATGWELCGWFSDPYAHQNEFCRMSAGVERSEADFTPADQLALATRPDNDLGDCLVFGPFTGAFPTQDWYLDLCVQGHHSDGGMGTFKVQLLRGSDPTGFGAQSVGIVQTGPIHSGFSTSAQTLFVIPLVEPPVLALDDEFLFFKVEWWNAGPVGSEHGGSDALLCIGPNACVRTPVFVASTVYKAVPVSHASPQAIAPRILQGVYCSKVSATCTGKTPIISLGVNVGKASATCTAKTPHIIAQAVSVPLAASHPACKRPVIAVEATVPDVHANPQAKTPRISLGITVPWAASSAFPLNPSIGHGAISIPTLPARAHPAWVAAIIAVGLVSVPISPAAAQAAAVGPSTGNAPVYVTPAPANASTGIVEPRIASGVRVRTAKASPGAKQPGTKFTYPKAEIMKLRVGAVDPQAMSLNITSSAALPDLTAVTSAQIAVFKPDRSEVVWDTTISNQTQSGLTLTHLFQATDLDLPGAYELKALLTTSQGIARTEPVRQYVAPAWEI